MLYLRKISQPVLVKLVSEKIKFDILIIIGNIASAGMIFDPLISIIACERLLVVIRTICITNFCAIGQGQINIIVNRICDKSF
jgi:hypothetical protein